MNIYDLPQAHEGKHFRAPAIKRRPLFWDSNPASLAIGAALVLACWIVALAMAEVL